MKARLHVQIHEEDRLLHEVPFHGDRLQVGRLPENDVVINHLSVSRIHAQLERVGDRVTVEDLGSQNGVWVNEERIDGSRAVTPEDTIRVGKHQLRLIEAPVAGLLEEVAPAEGVAFEAPELDARETAAAAMHSTDTVEADSSADPDSYAIEEHEVVADEQLVEGIAELAPEELWEPGEEDATSLVDDLAESEDGLESPLGDASPEPLFPGLVVQHEGQLDRVLPWQQPELCAGRAAECAIFLGGPEVSRRHALFVRVGDTYEVRDLDSINGVFVNGERIESRELSPGDVVTIESFELTFLLNPEPIEAQIRTGSEGPKAAGDDAEQLNLTLIGEAPLLAAPEPPDATALAMGGELQSFDLGNELESGNEFGSEDDEEKDLSHADGVAAAPLRLELEIAADALPEPLRAALGELGDAEVALPVTLRIRRP
jgi:pSer/pThr/pTyr-binding forkhead associated (FHA) protein